MKLVTFDAGNGEPRIGTVTPAGVVDLAKGDALIDGAGARGSFRDMLALIDAGPAALDRARRIEADVVAEGLRRVAEEEARFQWLKEKLDAAVASGGANTLEDVYAAIDETVETQSD